MHSPKKAHEEKLFLLPFQPLLIIRGVETRNALDIHFYDHFDKANCTSDPAVVA